MFCHTTRAATAAPGGLGQPWRKGWDSNPRNEPTPFAEVIEVLATALIQALRRS
jgi:hypothetical protein